VYGVKTSHGANRKCCDENDNRNCDCSRMDSRLAVHMQSASTGNTQDVGTVAMAAGRVNPSE
jgi:hypothetical protein